MKVDYVRERLDSRMIPRRVEEIVREASRRTGVPYADIVSGRRISKFNTEAKRIAIINMRLLLRMSYPQIGRYLRIHHTSAMHLAARGSKIESRDRDVVFEVDEWV